MSSWSDLAKGVDAAFGGAEDKHEDSAPAAEETRPAQAHPFSEGLDVDAAFGGDDGGSDAVTKPKTEEESELKANKKTPLGFMERMRLRREAETGEPESTAEAIASKLPFYKTAQKVGLSDIANLGLNKVGRWIAGDDTGPKDSTAANTEALVRMSKGEVNKFLLRHIPDFEDKMKEMGIKPGSEEEKQMAITTAKNELYLRAKRRQEAQQKLAEDNPSTGMKIAEGTVDAIAPVGEFAAGGVAAKAAKAVGIAGKVIAGAIPAISSGAKRAIDLATDDYYLDKNEKLQIRKGDSEPKAALKGAIGGAAEVGIQMGLGAAGKAVGGLAVKGLEHVPFVGGLTKFVEGSGEKIAQSMAKTDTGRAVLQTMKQYNDLAQSTQFQSVPTQMAKMYVQQGVDDVLGLDLKGSDPSTMGERAEQFRKQMADPKFHADMALGLLGWMAVQGSGALAKTAKMMQNERIDVDAKLRHMNLDKTTIDGLSTVDKQSLVRIVRDFASSPDKIQEAARRMSQRLGEVSKQITSQEGFDFDKPVPYQIPTKVDEKGNETPDWKMTVDGKRMLDNGSGVRIIDNGKDENNLDHYTIENDNGKRIDVNSVEDAIQRAGEAGGDLYKARSVDANKAAYAHSAAYRILGNDNVKIYKNTDEFLRDHSGDPELAQQMKESAKSGFTDAKTGEVSLILDNIESPIEIIDTLSHEGLHRAVLDAFKSPEERSKFLQSINDPRIQELSKRVGEKEGSDIAMEEALAYYFEQRDVNPTKYQEMVHGVRDWLRGKGVNLSLDKDDVDSIVGEMQKKVSGGIGWLEKMDAEDAAAHEREVHFKQNQTKLEHKEVEERELENAELERDAALKQERRDAEQRQLEAERKKADAEWKAQQAKEVEAKRAEGQRRAEKDRQRGLAKVDQRAVPEQGLANHEEPMKEEVHPVHTEVERREELDGKARTFEKTRPQVFRDALAIVRGESTHTRVHTTGDYKGVLEDLAEQRRRAAELVQKWVDTNDLHLVRPDLREAEAKRRGIAQPPEERKEPKLLKSGESDSSRAARIDRALNQGGEISDDDVGFLRLNGITSDDLSKMGWRRDAKRGMWTNAAPVEPKQVDTRNEADFYKQRREAENNATPEQKLKMAVDSNYGKKVSVIHARDFLRRNPGANLSMFEKPGRTFKIAGTTVMVSMAPFQDKGCTVYSFECVPTREVFEVRVKNPKPKAAPEAKPEKEAKNDKPKQAGTAVPNQAGQGNKPDASRNVRPAGVDAGDKQHESPARVAGNGQKPVPAGQQTAQAGGVGERQATQTNKNQVTKFVEPARGQTVIARTKDGTAYSGQFLGVNPDGTYKIRVRSYTKGGVRQNVTDPKTHQPAVWDMNFPMDALNTIRDNVTRWEIKESDRKMMGADEEETKSNWIDRRAKMLYEQFQARAQKSNEDDISLDEAYKRAKRQANSDYIQFKKSGKQFELAPDTERESSLKLGTAEDLGRASDFDEGREGLPEDSELGGDIGGRFRKSNKELDKDYLDAVKRGDMDTAQRMVRDAVGGEKDTVMKDGKPVVVYHGTIKRDGNGNLFYVFDPSKGGKNANRNGVTFLSSEKSFAENYPRDFAEMNKIKKTNNALTFLSPKEEERIKSNTHVYTSYLRSKKMFDSWNEKDADALLNAGVITLDGKRELLSSPDNWRIMESPKVQEWLKANGYDAFTTSEGGVLNYGVYDSSQIKLADPVTRDDAGNVIPLSERFNEDNRDIRFRKSNKELNKDTMKDRVIRDWQDSLLPIKKMEERIGLKDKAKSLYYLTDRLFGIKEEQGDKLKRDFVNPIAKGIADSKIPLKDYDELLSAMDGERRNQMIRERSRGENNTGSGKTDSEWRTIISKYKADGRYQRMMPVMQKVWDMNSADLQNRVDSGRMTATQAKRWRELSPHYVPSRKDMEEELGQYAHDRISGGYTNKEFAHAIGRSYGGKIDSPIIYSILQAERSIIDAADNVKRQWAAEIVRANPSLGTVLDHAPMKKALVNGFIQNVPDPNFGDQSINPNVVSFKESVPLMSKDGRPVVGADGKPMMETKVKYIRFDGEDGPDIALAITNANMHTLHEKAEIVRKTTRLYAELRTSLSPVFLVGNALADNVQTILNISSSHGIGAAKDFEKNLFPAFRAAWLHNHDEPQKNSKIAKLVDEYYKNGGRIGGYGTENFKEKEIELLNQIRQISGKENYGLKALRIAKDTIENLNSPVETGTRLAVYCTLRQRGMSVADAISYSRDVTVNFNRHGTWTPVFNSLYIFSNASIQDFARNGVAAAGKFGIRTMVAGTLLSYVLGLINQSLDDDDDARKGIPQYKDLPEYMKQNNIILRFGRKFVKIPIRGLARFPFYLGTQLAEMQHGNKTPGKLAADSAAFIAQNATDPFGSANSILENITPTILRPALQIETGKDWTGNDLYRKSFNRYAPHSSLGKASTETPYKRTAMWMNRLGGGNENRRSWLDVYPETIKVVMEALGGSLERDIGRGVGVVQDVAAGNLMEDDPRRVPFVNRVVGQIPENSSRFYDMMNEYGAAEYEMKDAPRTELRNLMKRYPFMLRAGSLKSLNNDIRKLGKDEQNARLPESSRKRIHQRRLMLQARFIKIMEGSRK